MSPEMEIELRERAFNSGIYNVDIVSAHKELREEYLKGLKFCDADLWSHLFVDTSTSVEDEVLLNFPLKYSEIISVEELTVEVLNEKYPKREYIL